MLVLSEGQKSISKPSGPLPFFVVKRREEEKKSQKGNFIVTEGGGGSNRSAFLFSVVKDLEKFPSSDLRSRKMLRENPCITLRGSLFLFPLDGRRAIIHRPRCSARACLNREVRIHLTRGDASMTLLACSRHGCRLIDHSGENRWQEPICILALAHRVFRIPWVESPMSTVITRN